MDSVWNDINKKRKAGKKMLAVLIDPDKFASSNPNLARLNELDYIFIGSSNLIDGTTEQVCSKLRAHVEKPLILFPGSSYQICRQADAILFMSLISGRNPEFLISHAINGAPLIKQAGLETISTGYILVESGNMTAAAYVTQTQPVPRNKPELALSTAMAGEMLGMKAIYLDGGSGAQLCVPQEMISTVKAKTKNLLIVGGGIKEASKAEDAWNAGADLVVIGSIFESAPELLGSFIESRNKNIQE